VDSKSFIIPLYNPCYHSFYIESIVRNATYQNKEASFKKGAFFYEKILHIVKEQRGVILANP